MSDESVEKLTVEEVVRVKLQPGEVLVIQADWEPEAVAGVIEYFNQHSIPLAIFPEGTSMEVVQSALAASP